MSIATQISRISGAKEDIRTALNSLGCSIGTSAKLDEYADYIANIGGGYISPNPLTFQASAAGNILWKTNNASFTRTIQYSKDNGTTWTSITSTVDGATIPMASGDVILIRGTNSTYANGTGSRYCSFGATANFYAYGNITDLLGQKYRYGLSRYCFYGLFQDNTYLRSHSSKQLVLPSPYTGGGCYYKMFRGCTKLAKAPTISATTLADSCFREMFYGCTALTTPPTLSVTSLAMYCYSHMFYGCTALTTAPSLPATSLQSYCYQYMFYGCTALAACPALSATSLASYCYSYMFAGCTTITTGPTLGATTLATYCYQYMFQNCTGLTSCPALSATTLTNYCYRCMFYGCTNITASPTLSAETLVTYCYNQMFRGCTKLKTIRCYATDITASSCVTNWVNGVAASGTFYRKSTMTSWPTSASGIPSGWTVKTVT